MNLTTTLTSNLSLTPIKPTPNPNQLLPAIVDFESANCRGEGLTFHISIQPGIGLGLVFGLRLGIGLGLGW
jgi:hypothetical protein